MSSCDDVCQKLAALESQGRLVRYQPRFGKPQRRLYLCEQALKDVSSPHSQLAILGLQGAVLAVFEHWASGKKVWVDPDGKPKLIKPLYPPDPKVWEMLALEPRAQVRIFFVFAEPNTIIATHARTRSFLGKKHSANWIEAKSDCMKAWCSLFGCAPFQGNRISDYVTENCDEFTV
jgi:hypothetical protein